MDELTKRRLVHNEQLFRTVNEERDQAHDDDTPDTKRTYVCECSDRECTVRIELTNAEYESVRRSPDRFILLPGHGIPEIERIVEDRGAFEVVEKDAA